MHLFFHKFAQIKQSETKTVSTEKINALYTEPIQQFSEADIQNSAAIKDEDIENFIKQAQHAIGIVRDKIPNFEDLNAKFLSLKRFKEVNNNSFKLQQINEIKKTIERIAAIVQEKSIDELSHYQDYEFICGEGTLTNLQTVLMNMTLIPSFQNIMALVKSEIIDQFLLNYLDEIRQKHIYEFDLHYSAAMEIHNVASLRNIIAVEANLKEVTLADDGYVRIYNDAEKALLKPIIGRFLIQEFAKKKMAGKFIEQIVEKIKTIIDFTHLTAKDLQDGLNIAGLELPSNVICDIDENGDWHIKKDLDEILKAIVAETLESQEILKSNKILFRDEGQELFKIIQVGEEFVSKNIATGEFSWLPEFSCQGQDKELDNISAILRQSAIEFKNIKAKGIKRLRTSQQGQAIQGQINKVKDVQENISANKHLQECLAIIDSQMVSNKDSKSISRVKIRLQRNSHLAKAMQKLPADIAQILRSSIHQLDSENTHIEPIFLNRLSAHIHSKNKEFTSLYIENNFTHDLKRILFLLEFKKVSRKLKEKCKKDILSFIESDEISELSYKEFKDLIFWQAIEIYNFGSSFRDILGIYKNNLKKFEGLTSWNAIEAYHAGASLAMLSDLYESDIERFEALTSFNANDIYLLGGKFDDLCNLDLDKIKALTHSNMQIILESKKIEGIELLKHYSVEKIRALTSYDAFNVYKLGVEFDELKEYGAEKIDVLTSRSVSNVYNQGLAMEDLAELYDLAQQVGEKVFAGNSEATNQHIQEGKRAITAHIFDLARNIDDYAKLKEVCEKSVAQSVKRQTVVGMFTEKCSPVKQHLAQLIYDQATVYTDNKAKLYSGDIKLTPQGLKGVDIAAINMLTERNRQTRR